MDYKSIVKSWANDLDQQAAKDVCVQFGLIEVEDSERVALDFEDLVKTPTTESLIGKTFKEERYLHQLFKELYKEYSSLKVYKELDALFFMVTLDGCAVLGGRKEWHVYAYYDTKADLYTITKITER